VAWNDRRAAGSRPIKPTRRSGIPASGGCSSAATAHLRSSWHRAGFELEAAEGLIFDFVVLGALTSGSRFFAANVTALLLKIRAFSRNSAFVCGAFRRQ